MAKECHRGGGHWGGGGGGGGAALGGPLWTEDRGWVLGLISPSPPVSTRPGDRLEAKAGQVA